MKSRRGCLGPRLTAEHHGWPGSSSRPPDRCSATTGNQNPLPFPFMPEYKRAGRRGLSSFLLQQQTLGSRGNLALPSSWAGEEYGPSSLLGLQTFLGPLWGSSPSFMHHAVNDAQHLKTAGMPGAGQAAGSPRHHLFPSDQYFHHV